MFLDVVETIFETNVRKCPQSAPALTVILTGHVDKVCLKKKRETANVSEETKTSEEKDKGEDKKDDKRNQTPPAGGRDFSRP